MAKDETEIKVDIDKYDLDFSTLLHETKSFVNFFGTLSVGYIVRNRHIFS